MEELIRNHWQIIAEFDTQHHVKLIVDEWGAWHKTDPSIDPSYLFAYFPTLRDALVSGITLDIFNRRQGGTSLRTMISASPLSQPAARGLPGLAGSCSLHGKHVVLTVVNPDIQNPQETRINVRGSKISGVRATVLTSRDIHAHNTFERPDTMMPIEDKSIATSAPLTYRFAPASVTRLEFDLA